MKASWYAEALYAALREAKTESDSKKIFARFRKVLSARGHEKLLHLISRELEKIIVREQAVSEVTLVTADLKSQNKWAHALDHYEKEGLIQKRSAHRNIVDESIVGGYQIRTKDILIDASYKKSLLELYRSIVNQN